MATDAGAPVFLTRLGQSAHVLSPNADDDLLPRDPQGETLTLVPG